MKILGISAYYHDSAAAIIADGTILAAMQEERFTRIKHDASFPTQAVAYCLQQAHCTIDELDAVVFYDKPFLKFERLIETYYRYAPVGIISFVRAMPVWMRQKLFLRKIIKEELAKIHDYDQKKLKLLFTEHHLSHAASAFYPSPYMDAAILTIDGVGEWSTASIAHGQGSAITVLKELHFPHSVGLLYSSFTYYLGFEVNEGEYKMMGLAPYGMSSLPTVERYKKLIKEHLVDIKEDGSIQLHQAYFDYAVGSRMTKSAKWQKLFGIARRSKDEPLTQVHADLALAIQQVTEEIVLKMAIEAKRLTGAEYLCLAGGVALNCVANGKLSRTGIYKDIWIQPAAGDAGGALGAALAAEYIYYKQTRSADGVNDTMQGALLGKAYTNTEIEQVLKNFNLNYRKVAPTNELCHEVAAMIANGKVVGWMQGRAEFGPRALGNRSILADPSGTAMQEALNLKIKFREGFRPFAPSVIVEDAKDYFQLTSPSPYMLLTAEVDDNIKKQLPNDYTILSFADRLATGRSSLPAITHVDFSARVQTVSRETNPLFYQLLAAFKETTGYAVLINTSFNVRGEPPVLSPTDAIQCFQKTGIDVLVMGEYVIMKNLSIFINQ